METFLRSVLISVLGTAIIILLKKNNPELSFAFSTTLVIFVMLTGGIFFKNILGFYKSISIIFGSSMDNIVPLTKCLAISIVSKLGADICKDGSQTALAGAVEFGGILSAAALALPVLMDTVKLIGTIV